MFEELSSISIEETYEDENVVEFQSPQIGSLVKGKSIYLIMVHLENVSIPSNRVIS